MADTTQDTQLESFHEAAEGPTQNLDSLACASDDRRSGHEALKNGGRPLARGTAIGPNATTKTLDKDAAQGSSPDDAEAAKLNAKIQADAQMKFSARTTHGKFRAPRSKGK